MLDSLLFIGVFGSVGSAFICLLFFLGLKGLSNRRRRSWRTRAIVAAPAAFFIFILTVAVGISGNPGEKAVSMSGCTLEVPSDYAVRAILEDTLPSNAKITSLTMEGADLRLAIVTGEWFSASGTGILLHLGDALKGLYDSVACFPAIQNVRADLFAARRDHYGRELSSGGTLVCSLSIPADNFRRFPDDFDWTMYGVYAANRYASRVNPAIREVWNTEVAEETRIGGFTSSNSSPAMNGFTYNSVLADNPAGGS
jgi:hypothetical protein